MKLPFPYVGGKLIQWGTNGFALAGSAKIFLVQTSLLDLPDSFPPPDFAPGDADRNRSIVVGDAVLVLRHIVGLAESDADHSRLADRR